MKSMVVGFDGTDAAFVAVNWAAEQAARSPTRVHIVMIGGTAFPHGFRVNSLLVSAERRVHERAPDAEVDACRFPGAVPESLFERAVAADLLVVGCHRGRPLRSALTGWLPLRIASGSPIPVVVVPDDWSSTSGPVVVGIDDDDSSVIASDVAAGIAERTGSRLVMVHAWQMPTPQMDGAIALLASPITVKAEHVKVLRDAARRAISAFPQLPVDRVLVQGSPSAALLEADQDASLLVLGTHHRGIFAGALLGSVGQEVLVQSPAPICVVPDHRAVRGADAA